MLIATTYIRPYKQAAGLSAVQTMINSFRKCHKTVTFEKPGKNSLVFQVIIFIPPFLTARLLFHC